MTENEEVLDKVAQHILDVAQGTIMHYNNFGISNPSSIFEHLKSILKKNEKYSVNLTPEDTIEVINLCINDTQEVKKYFYQNNKIFVLNTHTGILNAVIEKNHDKPKKIVELLSSDIVFLTPKDIDKTIGLIASYVPGAEGRKSLAFYLSKQENIFNLQSPAQILKGLKQHMPEHLEEFSFLSFVHDYLESQKVKNIFGNDDIAKTLMLTINYKTMHYQLENFNRSIDVFQGLFKDYVTCVFNDKKDEFDIHSHCYTQTDKEYQDEMYINLGANSQLTQKILNQSFNEMFKALKSHDKPLDAIRTEFITTYLPTFWHKEIMETSLPKKEEIIQGRKFKI